MSDVHVISISRDAYDALIERLEDLEDSLSILEARLANEPARPLDEFLQEQREMRIADVPVLQIPLKQQHFGGGGL